MDIRAAEISAILKQQIANFGTEAEVADIAVMFRYLLEPDALVIAEYAGEVAGVGMIIRQPNTGRLGNWAPV